MKKSVLLLFALVLTALSSFAQNSYKLEPEDLLEKSGDQWVLKSGTAISDCLLAKGWTVNSPASERSADCSVDKAGYKCQVYRSSYLELHFGTKAQTIEFYNKVKSYNTKGGSWQMNGNTVFLD